MCRCSGSQRRQKVESFDLIFMEKITEKDETRQTLKSVKILKIFQEFDYNARLRLAK